jgi:hypothetical protein
MQLLVALQFCSVFLCSLCITLAVLGIAVQLVSSWRGLVCEHSLFDFRYDSHEEFSQLLVCICDPFQEVTGILVMMINCRLR